MNIKYPAIRYIDCFKNIKCLNMHLMQVRVIINNKMIRRNTTTQQLASL